MVLCNDLKSRLKLQFWSDQSLSVCFWRLLKRMIIKNIYHFNILYLNCAKFHLHKHLEKTNCANVVCFSVFPLFLLLFKFSSSVDVISSIFVRLRTAQWWHVLGLCSPCLLEFRWHLFSPFIGNHRASWTFLYVLKPCLQSLFMSLTRNTYM